MDLGLKNKTVLVTSSHRGTGEIIAQTLLREGADVIFHGFEKEQGGSIRENYPRAKFVWGDIANEEGCTQLIEQLVALGGVDILINNFGTAARGSWVKSNSEDWLDMYQKNVLSAVRLVQGLSPKMKEKGWGRIVMLGTVGSHQPNNIMPHYYAAKGALATMAVSLTKELSNTGITVNTVSPGYIHTAEVEAGFKLKAQKENWGESWHEIEKKIVETEFPNPCGRIAKREEVADLVAFICSDRAGYINGQNIRIDGGAVSYV